MSVYVNHCTKKHDRLIDKISAQLQSKPSPKGGWRRRNTA